MSSNIADRSHSDDTMTRQALDRLLLEAENTVADSYGALDSQMNRIEDLLSYFNDIYLIGTAHLSVLALMASV